METTTAVSMSTISKSFRANLRTYAMVIALALIWILFGSLTGGIFLKPRNVSNLFTQMTVESFLAIGMVLVIVTGNIDLSVGSGAGFVSAMVAFFQARVFPSLLHGLLPQMDIASLGIISTVAAIVAGLLVGFVIGIWQGTLIAYLGIPAFIVTLGGMLIFRGGVIAVTRGDSIVPVEKSLMVIAQGNTPLNVGWIIGGLVIVAIVFFTFRKRRQRREFGFKLIPFYRDLIKAIGISLLVAIFVYLMNSVDGIPYPVLVMAAFAVIFTYITNNTKLGRYSYALGGNKEATRLSGINIKRIVFVVFILMGLMTGVSGIVLTGYVAAGTPGGGLNYELEAIASCVIGGTSLMGGEGTIIGAIVGALIMSSVLNGMSVMNMDVFWQYVIRGLVLVGAVYIDVISKRNRA